jgi:hypothetical protein
VFHRIQPIIDVEVLPPRHFVPNASGSGLIEIPASAVPGRQGYRNIVDTNLGESYTTENGTTSEGDNSATGDKHAAGQAIKTSGRSYVTKEGVTRMEDVLRHPPTLETGAFETGQTLPLNINRMASEQEKESTPRQPLGSNDGGDLLYKERGHGTEKPTDFHEDPHSPTYGYGPVDGEIGEATSFLRRKRAEKHRHAASTQSTANSEPSLQQKLEDLTVKD